MPVEQIETVEEVLKSSAFDEIIDVRSPSEFAEDHMPGAVNLPVLDDDQRAEVGTLYVQSSKFEAKKIGAALIARNVAGHLETHLKDKPGGYRPLIYCWRGGQRSGAMAHILGQVGWRVATLKGGYKAYRRHVSERFYSGEPWFELAVLDGLTGVGKTDVLERLAARGRPALDLEDLAAHRGSLFGADPDRPQPSQKMFESRLLTALEALRREMPKQTPILVEAESNMIGERRIPPVMWSAMLRAPELRLEASVDERAAYSERRYRDLAEDPARVAEILGKLIYRHGKARVGEWLELSEKGEMRALIADLLETHYDPAYAHSSDRRGRERARAIVVERLDEAGLEAAADAIAAMLWRS